MSSDPREMTPEQYLKLSKKASNTCKRVSDIPHTLESHPEEMRFITEKLNAPKIPDHLKPKKEWTSNLGHWFAHVRQNTISAKEQDTPSWSSIMRDLESQEMPTLRVMSQAHADAILAYFDKKSQELTKVDLHWIFASLTIIDVPLSQDMCVIMQNVKTTILKQLEMMNRNDERVSYMLVIITIISKYFGQ